MCRFVLYHGPEIPVADLVTRPRNSLLHQSYKAEWREEPLNGDGFGMAWYVPSMRPQPALFRSITPAWSNPNLRDLAEVVQSGAILAHVRAASPGLPVAQANCHPFRWRTLAFMHNGVVPDFRRVRRALLMSLKPEAFDMITGMTDSEHVFALLVDRYLDCGSLEQALRGALADLVRLVGPRSTSWLNIAVSDGARAVACRATLGPDQEVHHSLFVHSGGCYACVCGQCKMAAPCGGAAATVVSSEPLSDDPGWEPVPPNHLVRLEAGRADVAPLRMG